MFHNVYFYSIFFTLECVLSIVSSHPSAGADISHLGLLIYGTPNLESGKHVEEWNETSQVNPEELGEYVEGDILFPSKLSKNGLLAEISRWPDGVVPYEISGRFSDKEKDMINRAMEQYHTYTCIKFRRRTQSDRDWISFISSNTGCWSSVGRIGGRQEINFQSPNCFAKIGTVIHEMLHVLGFQHEQNRWERDSYVTVQWGNIQKGRENNFIKSGKDSVTGFGVPYDYNSVMHYSERAFSRNGASTITVKQQKVRVGQREGFSRGDVTKIRRMYKCPDMNNNVIEPIQSGSEEHENKGPMGGLISLLFPE